VIAERRNNNATTTQQQRNNNATTTQQYQHNIKQKSAFYNLKLLSKQLESNYKFAKAATMPQYHNPGGTISYPDAKSSYPTFPRVGFGRAVAIGLGAGFLGALMYVHTITHTV
jgi:hypothetical protein